MTFKIVVFAAALFACQVNAQIGGIIRPFATGFSNGLSEMAKPFVQLGQTVMSPASEYISGNRRPQVSQWMTYPSQMIPQSGAYEGYEAVASGMPGVSYYQVVRPNPAFKPQMQYYPSQPGFVRPPSPPPPRPPRPVPAPTSSSSSEESDEIYRPSNLLIQPAEVPTPEIPKVPEVPLTAASELEVPSLQRPLPIVEDE